MFTIDRIPLTSSRRNIDVTGGSFIPVLLLYITRSPVLGGKLLVLAVVYRQNGTAVLIWTTQHCLRYTYPGFGILRAWLHFQLVSKPSAVGWGIDLPKRGVPRKFRASPLPGERTY